MQKLDYKKRDQIIFGSNPPEHYDCKRFTCEKEKIETLVKEGFLDPKEYQNCSPTTQDFLDYTEGFEDYGIETKFTCYVIEPERDDTRVTIEGVNFIVPETAYDQVAYIVEVFHDADVFTVEHAWSNYYIHTWWD